MHCFCIAVIYSQELTIQGLSCTVCFSDADRYYVFLCYGKISYFYILYFIWGPNKTSKSANSPLHSVFV